MANLSVSSIDLTNSIFCDICGEDHSLRDVEGGMLFGSSGVCPTCTKRMLVNIKECGEEEHIKDKALPGESFRAFSIRMRAGNNIATIISMEGNKS